MINDNYTLVYIVSIHIVKTGLLTALAVLIVNSIKPPVKDHWLLLGEDQNHLFPL